MIHKYYLNGIYTLIDINSGCVFTIDEITYSVLDYYPEKDRENILKLLKDKYPKEEIELVMDEIDELINDNQLFTDDIQINSGEMIEPAIKALCLHVSHDCNIRCKYCFASQGDFNGEKLLMSEETGKKAIDFLIEQSKGRRNLEVDFFGGEPLMNMDVVKKLVSYAREKEKSFGKHFRFTMTTNGMLLNESNMNYLNENMDNIVLSIDGRKEINDRMRIAPNGEGTYDYIIKKIKKMSQIRGSKDHYVRGTYTKYNLDFCEDVQHLSEQGFKNISVEPVVTDESMDYAITENDLPEILTQYEKLAKYFCTDKRNFNFFHFNIDLDGGPCFYKRVSGCGAGSDYIAITPQGEIYPCHQFVGNEKFKMGDLNTGIVNKWIQDYFHKANLTDKDECQSCWAKYYCGGGCLANAYHRNGDVCIPDKIGCEMEKKRIECAIMIKNYNHPK